MSPKDGAAFVSSGRWTAWWNGKEQPTLQKINVIERILPGTSRWLEQGASTLKEHPAHTLLYAIDLWGAKESKIEPAMKLLMALASAWGPKCKREGRHQVLYRGWYLTQFSANRLLPSDLALDHYRALEPASIVESMVWTGNYFKIHTTEHFQRWLLDLVAAALVTYAILNVSDIEQAAVQLGGDAGLVASCVLTAFIHEASFFARTNKERQVRKAIEGMIGLAQSRIPTDTEFHELMWVALERFEMELHLVGWAVTFVHSPNLIRRCIGLDCDRTATDTNNPALKLSLLTVKPAPQG